MLQQLVTESFLLTSSIVSLVSTLLEVGEADLVGVGLCETIGVLLGVTLLVFLGVGVAFTTVPLFQMRFLPDLTQKYFTPPVVLVVPTLVHLVPAIVAACEGIVKAVKKMVTKRTLLCALNFMG